VLERLHWQRQTNTVERRTIGKDPDKKTVYVISKISDDGKKVWVCSGICVYVDKVRKDLQETIQGG